MLRGEAAEDIDRVLLLGLLRATGEEDDLVVANAGEFAKRLRARILAIGLRAVVLERSRNEDSIGRRAERAKAVGRFVVLCGNEIDLPQHRRNERANASIARKAMITHPAIDDRDPGAVVLGGPN